MTTKIFKNLHWLILGALTALLLYSCVYENIPSTSLEGDGEAMVKFSIKLPAAAIPATKTRALSSGDENDVHEIDILVFEKNKGEFVYRTGCSGSAITGTEQTKTFTVMLRKGEFDIVMLANARSAISGKSFTGKGKDAALEMIEVSMPTGGKWIATATDIGYKPFPMWGDMGNTTIDETTDLTGNNAIALTRMVARVDVTVPSTVTNFKLTGVDVYNYNSKGMLVPTATGTWNGSKAVNPNVPTGPGVLVQAPVSYGSDKINGTDNSCVSEIYIFEAENHTASSEHTAGKSLTDRTCLVVAGIWDSDGDGDFTDEGDPTYYRIDFSTGSGMSQTYLDVLRNHKYIFSITKVSGPGYETSQIAFETGPFNIEAKVLEWNEAIMGDVVFDGQNYLSVSPAEFDLYRDVKTGLTFEVSTDFTSGWEIIGAYDAPAGGTAVTWIKNFTGSFNAINIKEPVTFGVEENDSEAERIGYIRIKAGRLEYAVKVTQGIDMEIALSVLNVTGTSEISELVFASSGMSPTQPSAQSFMLRWMPVTENVAITKNKVENSEEFVFFDDSEFNGSTTNTSSTTGEQIFSVQPTGFGNITGNEFAERVSLVNFTVSSQGKKEIKSLYLRQVNYNTIVEVADYYMLDGRTYSFTIKSNTSWMISKVEGNVDILDGTSFTGISGGYNTSGETVSFKVINSTNGDMNGKIVTLTLSDPTGRMANVTVPIKGAICGTGGKAVALKIGSNGYFNDNAEGKTYLTHMYGGKCWMVQNSREVIDYTSEYVASTRYGYIEYIENLSANGYYYTWNQAKITNNACPDGWRLPDNGEFGTLMTEVNAEKTGKGKWWTVKDSNAFAGKRFGSTWTTWGQVGDWWSSSASDQGFDSLTIGMGGPYTFTGGYWFSVRCVQNQ